MNHIINFNRLFESDIKNIFLPMDMNDIFLYNIHLKFTKKKKDWITVTKLFLFETPIANCNKSVLHLLIYLKKLNGETVILFKYKAKYCNGSYQYNIIFTPKIYKYVRIYINQ